MTEREVHSFTTDIFWVGSYLVEYLLMINCTYFQWCKKGDCVFDLGAGEISGKHN